MELGFRYKNRLIAICDEWKRKNEFKNPRFSEWLTIFNRMIWTYDTVKDAGKEMLKFALHYADCIYRYENDMELFKMATSQIMKIAEFGLKSISFVEVED